MSISRRVEDIHEGGMVTRVQTALQNHGFNPGSINGIFGPETEGAVMQFQSQHNIKPGGIVGQLTWAALGFTGSVPRPVIID